MGKSGTGRNQKGKTQEVKKVAKTETPVEEKIDVTKTIDSLSSVVLKNVKRLDDLADQVQWRTVWISVAITILIIWGSQIIGNGCSFISGKIDQYRQFKDFYNQYFNSDGDKDLPNPFEKREEKAFYSLIPPKASEKEILAVAEVFDLAADQVAAGRITERDAIVSFIARRLMGICGVEWIAFFKAIDAAYKNLEEKEFESALRQTADGIRKKGVRARGERDSDEIVFPVESVPSPAHPDQIETPTPEPVPDSEGSLTPPSESPEPGKEVAPDAVNNAPDANSEASDPVKNEPEANPSLQKPETPVKEPEPKQKAPVRQYQRYYSPFPFFGGYGYGY